LGDFPTEDENMEIYQNIQKGDIHLVVVRPTHFPYNEAAQWCFMKFDINTTNIVRKHGKSVASLGPKDISLRYHLTTPTYALKEPLLKVFTQGNKGPVNLMKHWWVDEDETLKQGKNLFPTHRIKAPYKMLVSMLFRLYGD
jgi:hypothetical protein